VKKKELEIILQKVPTFKNPVPNLEQYLTPANIAADIIFIAHQFQDINNKTVTDLGCGTGIFSIGAKITGAKKVFGVDIDKNSIEIAKRYSDKVNLNIEFLNIDVSEFNEKCDTILMNPPFGAQKSNINIDRNFINKGFEVSSVIYSMHLSKTLSFIKKLVDVKGGKITFSKNYKFPIKWIFDFHKKKVVEYDINMIRIETDNK
jgi:putative methylase